MLITGVTGIQIELIETVPIKTLVRSILAVISNSKNKQVRSLEFAYSEAILEDSIISIDLDPGWLKKRKAEHQIALRMSLTSRRVEEYPQKPSKEIL